VTAHDVAARVLEDCVLAIVRAHDVDVAEAMVRALVEGGIRVLELSLSGAAAIEAIRRVRRADLDVIVGAGTVLTVADAEAAVEAGAGFLVSPNFPADVLEWAQARDMLHIPGAFTPSEVAAVHAAGAPLIKLFPGRPLGPEYVRDLLGPFPQLKLVPTGGIDEGNAAAFIAAGAAAVAVGGALTDSRLAAAPQEVIAATRRLRAAVAQEARFDKEAPTCQ
jgi:2-dehydro-3-deoxyphosphogluconate aldolase/(4S)-4-hydroxy-2-oxoglutarate aldolase